MGYREFFRKATGRDPFPFQEDLAKGPWPRVLRVPTGCGKTEAVLGAWLYRRLNGEGEPRRLVYCLPLRALVFQTVERARRMVQNLGLQDRVLVQTLAGGEVEEEWCLYPEREAILVGTMDMLLSRALNRGYGLSRFRSPVDFGLLTNDVFWVFDEAQLMGNGLWTSAALAGLLSRWGTFGPVRALWCSATVEPDWLKTPDHPPPQSHEVLRLGQADRNHPELAKRLGARKVVRRLEKGDPATLAQEAVRRAQDGQGPVLVVVNTVKRALAVHREVERALGENRALLLHSRFRPPDRREQEGRLQGVLKDPGGVVVATQVVEAGMDLSARVLITDAAPVASLVQRLGRCNRFGEWEEAEVLWTPPEDADPYSPEEVEAGRDFLEKWEGKSASPLALDGQPFPAPPGPLYPLRARDLLDLFDTAPDLVGSEPDVSRFIRDDRDLDVYLFWRDLQEPGERLSPPPSTEEVCPVPFYEVRDFLKRKGGRAWRFDPLDGGWVSLRPEEVRPGLWVLLPSEAGGYSRDRGFDPEATGAVEPVAGPAREQAEEATGEDPHSFGTKRWVLLEDHARETREEMGRLLRALGGVVDQGLAPALLEAAFWHDLGKAHPVFRETMEQVAKAAEERGDPGPPGQGVWAKSPVRSGAPGYPPGLFRHSRPHFRHELASALALLAWERQGGGPLKALPRDLRDPRALRDLLLYLVAAHHGRVRTAIRSVPGEDLGRTGRGALGVHEGDEIEPLAMEGWNVPRLVLDLEPMELGSPDSWTDLAGRLLERWGPFRLAYLEALVRIADWRVSR